MPMTIPLPGLAETSLYYAFRNSDMLGQGIVVVLFLFSMITWTIMIEKGKQFEKCASRQCGIFDEIPFQTQSDDICRPDRG